MILQSVKSTEVTVGEMVSILSNAYCSLINKDIPLEKFPSVMLWGPPGVGKSQGVRQVAAQIQQATGKIVEVTDVRLLLFNPVDLRGIPTANADKTLAVWLKPKIFQLDESSEKINILLLDEISAAPPSVQAAAYQITLDRTIGEHKLPENCIVIAAGNRTNDKSVAYKMPKALANRLCHLDVYSNADSWKEWALKSNIHEKVIGFIEYKPEMLSDFDAKEESNSFATARSWEMVSNILNVISDKIEDNYPLIAGCVGEKAAKEFKNWDEIYTNVPAPELIFKGEHKIVPQMPAILFALSSGIVAYARKNQDKNGIDNAIAYVNRFPVEFKNKIFSDFLRIREIRRILEDNDIFCEWVSMFYKGWM